MNDRFNPCFTKPAKQQQQQRDQQKQQQKIDWILLGTEKQFPGASGFAIDVTICSRVQSTKEREREREEKVISSVFIDILYYRWVFSIDYSTL